MQTYGVIERIAEALWDKCKSEGDADILKAEEYGFKDSIIELFSVKNNSFFRQIKDKYIRSDDNIIETYSISTAKALVPAPGPAPRQVPPRHGV